jgi:ATP-dependent DNA helicase RecQ
MQRAPLEVLEQYWGYDAFRPLQADIIASALAGVDALALLPTGGGKSICYQVPALCMDGICIVVSPLIALMKDQVQNLQNRGIPAAAVYAGMNRRALDITFENACNGAYKLLYISPERLTSELARARLARMQVNLIAIDEAHCISQWGYDFRPPYLQIAQLRTLLPNVPFLALTATATKEVVDDIQEKLEFKEKKVFRQGFARPNLSYSVLYEYKKREKLVQILRSVPGTGIVYARSRGETKEIAQLLQKQGIRADYYHAGLTPEERNNKQDAWMNNQVQVIVSTNAFGMGIDKPDVRIVVHLALPESLEAYFQEAGRGGRDGKKSYAVLLFAPADEDALRFHLKTAFPDFNLLRQTYQALCNYTQLAIGAGEGESFDFDLQDFSNRFKLELAPAHAALRLLEQEGWISISDASSSPASACITASRDVLYDYQLRNRQADVVTKVLLRAYPGIQHNWVDISEPNVARFANLPLETVIQVLETAQKENILHYQPKKDKPQLIFLRPRVAASELEIDLVKFNFRKQAAEQRMEQAIRYATLRRCRSQLLLHYFGEEKSPTCGICDVCTGRNESDVPAALFEQYTRKIQLVLKHEALPLEEILQAFAPKRHEVVAQVLQFLMEEGKLTETEKGLKFK